MAADEAQCPFPHSALPVDGTPLHPSPTIGRWREQAPATPLHYTDGHEGLIATRYDIARSVLQDERFSVRPARTPLNSSLVEKLDRVAAGPHDDHVPLTETAPDQDDGVTEALRINLLSLDGAHHARLRRAVTARFSVKSAKARRPDIAATVRRQLDLFRAEGSPNEVWHRYAQPIATTTHCQVLGVPPPEEDRFRAVFLGGATAQGQFDFVRGVLEHRRAHPGQDVASDLIAMEELTDIERESLLHGLMGAGHDSVAYIITTALVALLTHPDQLALLRDDPAKIGVAVEEFMRMGAMFLTLFPRTATEDVAVDEFVIPAGTTVSVSPVGANRDPAQWHDAERFDVERDAFGHLGFGHGIHGCIGQQVARVEISEAVALLIRELPDLALVSAEQLEPLPFANPVATYEAGEVFVSWS